MVRIDCNRSLRLLHDPDEMWVLVKKRDSDAPHNAPVRSHAY